MFLWFFSTEQEHLDTAAETLCVGNFAALPTLHGHSRVGKFYCSDLNDCMMERYLFEVSLWKHLLWWQFSILWFWEECLSPPDSMTIEPIAGKESLRDLSLSNLIPLQRQPAQLGPARQHCLWASPVGHIREAIAIIKHKTIPQDMGFNIRLPIFKSQSNVSPIP